MIYLNKPNIKIGLVNYTSISGELHYYGEIEETTIKFKLFSNGTLIEETNIDPDKTNFKHEFTFENLSVGTQYNLVAETFINNEFIEGTSQTVITNEPTISYLGNLYYFDIEGLPTTFGQEGFVLPQPDIFDYYAGDYEFDGWYLDKDLTQVVSTIDFFGDYTLYPKINYIGTTEDFIELPKIKVEKNSRTQSGFTVKLKNGNVIDEGIAVEGTGLQFGKFDFDEGDFTDYLEYNKLIRPSPLELVELNAVEEDDILITNDVVKSHRFDYLISDTEYKIAVRSVVYDEDAFKFSEWLVVAVTTLEVDITTFNRPIAHLLDISKDDEANAFDMQIGFDYNNLLEAGSEIDITSNAFPGVLVLPFTNDRVRILTFEDLQPGIYYFTLVAKRNVTSPFESVRTTYSFRISAQDEVVIDTRYKILLGKRDITQHVAQGFSIHEKITYDLDEGSVILPFTAESMNDDRYDFTKTLPMFEKVFIYEEGETRPIFSGRISNDFCSINGKGDTKYYKHEIRLVEHTKMLERYWISGKTFTQPTEKAEKRYKPYTLLDVIRILRDNVPTRLAVETPFYKPYDISLELTQILGDIEAPEFNFKGYNLREALNEVLSYIDAKVRLDENNELHADFFNIQGDIVTDVRSTQELREQDTNEYATTLISMVSNAVVNNRNEEFRVKGNTTYPGGGGFTGVRSDDYIFDLGNVFIPTGDKPIYDVKRVLVTCEGDVTMSYREPFGGSISIGTYDVKFVFPITDRVVEKKFFEILEEETFNSTDLSKRNVIVYEYGKPNIDGSKIHKPILGVGFETISLTQAIYRSFIENFTKEFWDMSEKTLREGGTHQEWVWEPGSDQILIGDDLYEYSLNLPPATNTEEIYNYGFRVEFTSLPAETRIDIDREDTSEISKYSELLTNQKARIVDMGSFFDKMKFNIDKKGLSNLQHSERKLKYKDTYNLGDRTEDNFIITEKETVFFGENVRSTYKFNKNFNKTSLFHGVHSQVRQWEIGESGRTIERDLSYKEFITVQSLGILEDGTAPLKDTKMVNSDYLYEAIEATMENDGSFPSIDSIILETYNGDELKPGTWNKVNDRDGDYDGVEMAFTKNHGGNSIILSFGFDNNISAGKKATSDVFKQFLGIRRRAIERIRYADSNGRFNHVHYTFLTSDGRKIYIPADIGSQEYTQDLLMSPLVRTDDIPGNVNQYNYLSMPGKNVFSVDKDNREVIKFNLGYQFIPLNTELIIGRAFIEGFRAFSSLGANPTRLYTYNTHKFNKSEYIKAPTPNNDYPLSGTWQNAYKVYLLDPSQTANVSSWAIVDDDGYILIANNNSNHIIQFNTVGRRRDVEYFDIEEPPLIPGDVGELSQYEESGTHEITLPIFTGDSSGYLSSQFEEESSENVVLSNFTGQTSGYLSLQTEEESSENVVLPIFTGSSNGQMTSQEEQEGTFDVVLPPFIGNSSGYVTEQNEISGTHDVVLPSYIGSSLGTMTATLGWVAGGTSPQGEDECSIYDDVGNVKCDVATCEFDISASFSSSTDDSYNVGEACEDVNNRIVCFEDPVDPTRWQCVYEITIKTYENCQTCELIEE